MGGENVLSERILLLQIDELKRKIHKLVESHGLSDVEVLRASQELDRCINEFYRQMADG
ncbi:MAG: aspartyl-phosphate phosphatase Spo0E family protein [Syntrophomonadaceae bacterium]|nr:aspartyl-phosphate phosphatase Spo0E family protein [Syntrophomonadaceae bacterium]